MEPLDPEMTLLGLVIESTHDQIILQLPGQGNFLRLHVSQLPHIVKVGDHLPLFTRVPYGKPRN
jgi:hypothetical protein